MRKITMLAIILASFTYLFTNAQTQVGSRVYATSSDENFAETVTMSSDGKVLAISADGTDTTNGSGTGYVRIYEFDSTSNNWVQKGNDIFGDNSGDKFGNSLALNSNGNLLAIGIPLSDFYSFQSGIVKVYEFNSLTNQWEQKGTNLTDSLTDYFTGNSISFNSAGSRIAIGTPSSQSGGTHIGNIVIFDFDTSSNDWVQIGSTITGTENYTNLGYSVALDDTGNTIVAGGPGLYRNGNPAINGVVKIYQLSGNNWVQKGQNISGNETGDFFGATVDINANGDQIIVGALLNDENSENAGKVEIYQFENSNWTKKGGSILGNEGDKLGSAVKLNNDGDRISVGSNGFESDKGKVETFKFLNNNWQKEGNSIIGTTAGDRLGNSISINQNGELVAMGSFRNDDVNNYFQVFNTNSTLSLNDIKNDHFRFYISDNILYINSNNTLIHDVKMYNSLGQEITLKPLNSEFSELGFTKSSSSNIYFLKIETDKGITNKKILFKKS